MIVSDSFAFTLKVHLFQPPPSPPPDTPRLLEPAEKSTEPTRVSPLTGTNPPVAVLTTRAWVLATLSTPTPIFPLSSRPLLSAAPFLLCSEQRPTCGADGKGTGSGHLPGGTCCFWRKRQPTPVFLPKKSHGQRSLEGYSPWGRRESDMTEHTRTHTHTHTHTWSWFTVLC